MSASFFHRGSVAFVLSMAFLQLANAPAHSASVVQNPGALRLTLTGGSAKIGSNPDAALAGPSTLSGRIDADGNISIPASGVSFAPIQIRTDEITATVRIQATNDVIGQLDPSTGEASLRLPFRLKIEAPALPIGNNCYVGTSNTPIDVNQAVTTGGAAYSQSSGNVTLVKANFPIPGANGCRGFDREVGEKIGASGSLSLSFNVSPAIKSGGKKIEGGIKAVDERPLPPSAGLVDPPTYPPVALGGGNSSKPQSEGVNVSTEQQLGSGAASFKSKSSFYDDGTASAFISCEGSIRFVCQGKVRIRLSSKKRRWIGARRYRLDPGEISELAVTVRLAKTTIRKAKSVKLVAVLSPTDGGKTVEKKLLMTF